MNHCYLNGCTSVEYSQMFLWTWALLIKSQFRLSNRVHQLLPGSSGCSWPGPAHHGNSWADSEASAPHPCAPRSYSCGAVAAACAPLKSCPHKHMYYIHRERHTLTHEQTRTTIEGLGWQWKHTEQGSLFFKHSRTRRSFDLAKKR